MHVVVLASPESWYLRDLVRAGGGEFEIAPVAFRQLTAALGPSPADARIFAGLDLAKVDAVIVRTMPPGSLEQVVFRMDVLGRLEAAGKVVINPPRAIEAAVDKYLASAKLAAAGLRTPRTVACQTVEDAMQAFTALGGDVVVKPLFGAEGRGITRLADEGLAQRAFSLLVQLGAVLYLQEFIPHDGYDIRVLAVGRRMWAIRRRNELDWRTNVSRGARAEPAELTDELVEATRRATEAVGAPVAGVDLLPARDGTLFTIEVNAVPGWQALARAHRVDVARHVLELVRVQAQARAEHDGPSPE
jgi:ribosomal protein S6--L-glutamate ligase